MSIKVNIFRGLLGNPMNTHNFYVRIPRMSDVELLVSATSFPTEKLETVPYYYQGEIVYYPTMPRRGGTWTCTLPEGEYAKVYRTASLEFGTDFLQKIGIMNHYSNTDKFDILVAAKSIRAGVVPMPRQIPMSVRLEGCVFLGLDPVQLNSGQANQMWVWNLTFSYDSLVYLPAIPMLHPPKKAFNAIARDATEAYDGVKKVLGKLGL